MAAAHRILRQEVVEVVNGPGRAIRDRQNPMGNLSEEEVFGRFRFRPATIYLICNDLQEVLMHGSVRNSPLPVLLQVLATLRFLATGTFQLVVGDLLNISQPTVSRTCRRVAAAIAATCRRWVRFPREPNQVGTLKMAFRDVAGFPNVIGCIDCTHVRIQRPSDNEIDFLNRKGYHSLNVQMICDNHFKITSLVAKWPGSTHDARVWRDCDLSTEFENGIHNGFIIGDSGYPCKPYLMTPFLNPSNRQQERFNGSLCRTRVLIEQTFGIIKRRFPILHTGIRSNPNVAVQYITACVVLHNIGVERRDIINHEEMPIQIDENHEIPLVGDTGNQIRVQIATQFF